MRQTLRDGPAVRRGMHPAAATATAASEFRPSDDDFDEKVSHESDLTRNRTTSHDLETQPQSVRRESAHGQKEDPFGNEAESEVKYRTLRWW